MVQLGGQYDGQESTFEPIPAGEYPMHITASEMRATKDGRGRFLALEMEVIDGPAAGRKLTERLNLENPNSQAVDIAQRTLRAIIFASGLDSCSDSERLHMRRMLVRVNVVERKDKPGQMSNEIGGYKKAGNGGGATVQQPAANGNGGSGAAASSGTAGGGAPPWKRAG